MIRKFPRRQNFFRALSTGISKTRYEAEDIAQESSRPASIPTPQVDDSSIVPPNSGAPNPSQTPPSLQEEITSVMREVPHSLTIILSDPLTHPYSPLSLLNSESDENALPSREPAGLLVSSFNTVTFNPIPFVSFNIKLPSRTHSAILASESFTASGINSIELAQKFLLPSGPKKSHILKACTFNTKEGGPWLRSSQGGLWWMHCNWVREKSVQVGDHVIMVGEVVSAGKYPKRNARNCLFYMNGAWRVCPKNEAQPTDEDSSKRIETEKAQPADKGSSNRRKTKKV